MIAVDESVLIAAHRAEHPHHERAYTRLCEIATGTAPWCLPVFCVAEFVRVVTHPRVFSPPSDLSVAADFLARLLSSPTVRLLAPGASYWGHLRRALMQADARGNLAYEAQIAAVCAEHGATRLVTADRDFARFASLTPEFL